MARGRESIIKFPPALKAAWLVFSVLAFIEK
jgi:hypothetical protein